MIDLYTLATPNGQKASIALEELGLPYTTHVVNIMEGEQFEPEYLKINPNNKIPAIVDQDGPGGTPIAIMESGAILIHLARKAGKLLPADPRAESEVLQWLFFQVGHEGPMFGQFGHFFKFAREACDHPYPLERYTKETRRILGVMNERLAGREWFVADTYTIADIALCPWVLTLDGFYEGGEHLGLAEFEHVNAWTARCKTRPAFQRGLEVGKL